MYSQLKSRKQKLDIFQIKGKAPLPKLKLSDSTFKKDCHPKLETAAQKPFVLGALLTHHQIMQKASILSWSKLCVRLKLFNFQIIWPRNDSVEYRSIYLKKVCPEEWNLIVGLNEYLVFLSLFLFKKRPSLDRLARSTNGRLVFWSQLANQQIWRIIFFPFLLFSAS